MDKWFELIISAVQSREATAEERRIAVARAGAIAQTYAFNEEGTQEVFGTNLHDPERAQGSL